MLFELLGDHRPEFEPVTVGVNYRMLEALP